MVTVDRSDLLEAFKQAEAARGAAQDALYKAQRAVTAASSVVTVLYDLLAETRDQEAQS
jgi:hypothetical protein